MLIDQEAGDLVGERLGLDALRPRLDGAGLGGGIPLRRLLQDVVPAHRGARGRTGRQAEDEERQRPAGHGQSWICLNFGTTNTSRPARMDTATPSTISGYTIAALIRPRSCRLFS